MKGREMRDNRYTNMWGESPEEQEKRRAWLRGVYDRATTPEQTQQPANNQTQSNFGQSGFAETAGSKQYLDHTSDKGILDIAGQAIQTADRLNADNSINNDKYKHAYVSCEGAQNGLEGVITLGGLGLAKEGVDVFQKSWNKMRGKGNYKNYSDIFNDSWEDLKADVAGLRMGYNNPDQNCDELIGAIYPRRIKY